MIAFLLNDILSSQAHENCIATYTTQAYKIHRQSVKHFCMIKVSFLQTNNQRSKQWIERSNFPLEPQEFIRRNISKLTRGRRTVRKEAKVVRPTPTGKNSLRSTGAVLFEREKESKATRDRNRPRLDD